MKEDYFSTDTIARKSKQMLDDVYDQRSLHNIAFSLDHSALLVLDMQDYFLKESSHAFIPSAPAIIPNILSLIHAYEKHTLPIIFTRHINTPKNGAMMLRWWKEWIGPETPASDICAELDTTHSTIIEKPQYDAFFKTSLDELLCKNKIEKVVVTGVMTHLCCETTARSAFMRGYEVYFAIDGTATYNERYHRATLLNLAHGFVIPILTAEIIQLMQKCA